MTPAHGLPARGSLRLYAIILVAVTLFGLRAALPAWIGRHINGKSDDKGGYGWRVEDVDVQLLSGSYDLEGVSLRKRGLSSPLFTADRVRSRISGVFNWPITTDMESFGTRLDIDLDPSSKGTKSRRRPDWPKLLNRLTWFRVDRLTIRDGEIRFHDPEANPPVELQAHDVDIQARNLFRADGDGESSRNSRLEAKGVLMGSGRFEFRTDLQPEAAVPTFDADFSMRGLELKSMNPALEAYAGMAVEKGRLDVETHAKARGGGYQGVIRSELHDFEMKDAAEKPKGFVKALEGKAVRILGRMLENKTKENEAEGKGPPQTDFSGDFPAGVKDGWSRSEFLIKEAFRKGLIP
ncbi:MAG: DUF748 domain-containing protein [Fibrobacteria bacterium]